MTDAQSPVGPGGGLEVSIKERVLAAVALLVGLAVAGTTRAHDTRIWSRAVFLAASNMLLSFALFRVSLRLLQTPVGRRNSGAFWAQVPWNAFHLSQIAYVGFFFIPVEVVAAAFILKRRARLQGGLTRILVSTVVRMIALGLTLALRPVVISLFPVR